MPPSLPITSGKARSVPTNPKPKAYIAGPMRKIAAFNFPAFRDATEVLRGLGYEVWSPHEYDENSGFHPYGLTGHEDLKQYGFNLRKAIARDLEVVVTWSDMVIVLPGWETSLGVAAEVAAARAIGLPVITYEEAKEALYVA